MQPGAVVALLDLALELVVLAQPQHVEREEAIRAGAQRFAGARREARRQHAGRARCTHADGRRRDRHIDARIAPIHEIGTARRQREPEALDQRAVGERVAAIDASAHQREPRCGQHLHECEQLGMPALRERRQPQLAGECVAEQGVGGRRRAEPAVVGAGEDDRGERSQHRACQRCDDHLRARVRGCRRHEAGLLEHAVDPVLERVETHHDLARAERPGARRLRTLCQAQRNEQLAAGIVRLQRGHGATTIQCLRECGQPRPECLAPRRGEPGQHVRRHRPQAGRGRGQFDVRQNRDAGDLAAAAGGFERRQGGTIVRTGPHGAGLEPIEQGIGACVGACGHQQRHDLRGRTRGRELPAGFVKQRDLLALQQRPHAAHQHAILRDQRDGRLAALHVREHLRRGALRLVFEVVTPREGGRAVGGHPGERIPLGRIGLDHQRRRRRGDQQRLDQRVWPAGLHCDPGRWLRHLEQPIRCRRRCEARPFERDPRQQPLGGARPGQRDERPARHGPVRGARRGRQCECRLCQRLGRGCQRRRGPLESARITARPCRAPRLTAQQRRRAQRVDGGVERDLSGRGRWRRAQACRECAGRLDARLPTADARKSVARERQQLHERQQNDRVAQFDAVVLHPQRHSSRQRPPAIPARRVDFKGQPFYRCHRNEDGRKRPHGPRESGRCVRIIVPCHPFQAVAP